MSQFNGFSDTGLQFLADLRANNNREWFDEHKQVYKEEIVEPALDFIVDLGGRLRSIYTDLNFDTRTNGAGSLMRIYRDIRFSKDKTPYRTNVGIVFWQGEGKKMERPGFYLHIDAEDAWMGGGWYIFTKAVLESYREAVADETGGAALAATLAQLKAQGYEIWGDRYKRVPQGYPQDHPRAELLMYKGIFAKGQDISRTDLTSPALVDRCYDICAGVVSLQEWLGRIG